MDKPKKHIYTTINGREVPFQAISLTALELAQAGVAAEFREAGKPIDPPMYEVELQGGVVEEFPHNPTTLEVKGDPEQTLINQALWDAHQKALKELKSVQSILVTEIILDDAVLVDLPVDNGWVEKQKRRHIRVPEDPTLRRRHYIQTEVLETQEDLISVVSEVMILSSAGAVKEEELRSALDSFRNSLQGQAAQRLTRSALIRPPDQEGPLDALDSPPRDPYREGVGDDSLPVPEST